MHCCLSSKRQMPALLRQRSVGSSCLPAAGYADNCAGDSAPSCAHVEHKVFEYVVNHPACFSRRREGVYLSQGVFFVSSSQTVSCRFNQIVLFTPSPTLASSAVVFIGRISEEKQTDTPLRGFGSPAALGLPTEVAFKRRRAVWMSICEIRIALPAF